MLTIDELRSSQRAVVTVREAACLLRCDPRTVTAALSIHGGDIRAVRVGRRVVIPAGPLLAYIEGERVVAEHDRAAAEVDDPNAAVRSKLIELLGVLEGVGP